MPPPKNPEKRKLWIQNRTGTKNHFYGKRHSEETRQKISKAKKGKKLSDETCKKMSAARKGKPLSIEHRKKLSESNKGRPSFRKNQHLSETHKRNISKALMGEKSPTWKGGVSFEPYCPKFTNEFKERVRAFFGHQCQMCGHVWREGERKLAVHHVNFKKDSCCSPATKKLFVPLCESCHGKTGMNRVFWEYWFTELINYIYEGKCYVTKDEEMKQA